MYLWVCWMYAVYIYWHRRNKYAKKKVTYSMNANSGMRRGNRCCKPHKQKIKMIGENGSKTEKPISP